MDEVEQKLKVFRMFLIISYTAVHNAEGEPRRYVKNARHVAFSGPL